MRIRSRLPLLAGAFLIWIFTYSPAAIGAPATSFNYQGRLLDGGAPANGIYDLEFSIFPTLSGGSPLTSALVLEDVPINGGLFTVDLDFGAGVFAGEKRWLAISVRAGSNTGGFFTLPMRQVLASVPQSQYALVAGGVIDGGIYTGMIANGAVTSEKIQAGAVTTSKVAAEAIASENIQTAAITAAKIADGAITSDKIQTAAVTGEKIADGAISGQKIANGSIDSLQIAGGAIKPAHIANGAIGLTHIAEGAITASHLAKPPRFGTINSADLEITFKEITPFSVIFDPPMAATPFVSLSVEGQDTKALADTTFFVTSRSPSGFQGQLHMPSSRFNLSTDLELKSSQSGGTALVSLANGFPGVSFSTWSSPGVYHLVFRHAADFLGAAWSPVITLDTLNINSAGSDPTMSMSMSLAVVANNPAISYFDEPNWDLKYVRATDSLGTSWGAPRSVQTEGNVGRFTSLIVISGKPAICYRDDTRNTLEFVHALDAEGASWGNPVSLNVNADQYSMAIVDGHPAIVYIGRTDRVLGYVRASDPEGTAWGVPVEIDRWLANSATVPSLIASQGHPAVSYYFNDSRGSTIREIRYSRAVDARGAQWNSPAKVVLAGVEPRYTLMMEVNGRPAILCVGTDPALGNWVPEDERSAQIWALGVDAIGSAWEIIPLQKGYGSIEASMAMIGGQPAIFFRDFDDFIFKDYGDYIYLRPTRRPFALNWTAITP